MLLYKAAIQDRKNEIIANEEEYLKVLNVVDDVMEQVEKQLKEQSEGNLSFLVLTLNLNVFYLLQILYNTGNQQESIFLTNQFFLIQKRKLQRCNTLHLQF